MGFTLCIQWQPAAASVYALCVLAALYERALDTHAFILCGTKLNGTHHSLFWADAVTNASNCNGMEFRVEFNVIARTHTQQATYTLIIHKEHAEFVLYLCISVLCWHLTGACKIVRISRELTGSRSNSLQLLRSISTSNHNIRKTFERKHRCMKAS